MNFLEEVRRVTYYQDEPLHHVFCLDVKSFYASVECLSRGLDPMTTMLVVMSGDRNTSGLVLSASPAAKKKLNVSNVCRGFDVPKHPELVIAPPRMKLYMTYHKKILAIFRRYMADEDIHVYSIDEQFGDLTKSYHLFGTSPEEVCSKIQQAIFLELGLYTTIGLSVNVLLAKVCMDVEAKKNAGMFAHWGYEDVKQKMWPLQLSEFWGIGKRMELRLNQLGLYTVGDLALSNPFLLKTRFGVMGLQYYMHAWGIDRSVLAEKEKYQPKEKSIGNSQVLPRGYISASKIQIVLAEMCVQLAQRLRTKQMEGSVLSLHMQYAYEDGKRRGTFSHQMKIPPTNHSKRLTQHVLRLFQKYWNHSEVRTISLYIGQLYPVSAFQLSLFEDPNILMREEAIDQTISDIRNKYSFTSIFYAHSLLEGATALRRATLVGGHAGGMDGLDGKADE